MTAWPFVSYGAAGSGRLAQLVRALPSHGRGQRFESFVAHHSLSDSHFSGKLWCQPSSVRSSFYLRCIYPVPTSLHLASRTEGTSRDPCSTATIWMPSE